MKLIFKKDILLYNKTILIYLEIDAELSKDYKSINNFDIDNFKEKIDIFFDMISNDFFSQTNNDSPVYIKLSKMIFDELVEVQKIKFETKDMVSIIERRDLILK